MHMADLLNAPGTVGALVGATDEPWKFGHRIFHDLTRKGIEVLPVNRGRATVAGQQAYPTLAHLPSKPDIVNVVVPPEEGPGLVREVAALGWDNVWFQPGAESTEARRVAEELGVEILEACTMVVVATRRSA